MHRSLAIAVPTAVRALVVVIAHPFIQISLKLLQESPYQLHFVDEMRMEYGIMVRLIHHPDFREGVRALLIDKDNAPNWHPTNPAVIGDAEVEAFFEPLPVEEQWRPFDF